MIKKICEYFVPVGIGLTAVLVALIAFEALHPATHRRHESAETESESFARPVVSADVSVSRPAGRAPGLISDSIPLNRAAGQTEIPDRFRRTVEKALENGTVVRVADMVGRRAGGRPEAIPPEVKSAGVETARHPVQAGFHVDPRHFDEAIIDCLPSGVYDEDSRTLDLKSEALAMIGFSAAVSGDSGRAREAYEKLLHYYPESEQAPVVRLELANVLRLAGDSEAAWTLAQEALARNGNDPGYAALVRRLMDVLK